MLGGRIHLAWIMPQPYIEVLPPVTEPGVITVKRIRILGKNVHF